MIERFDVVPATMAVIYDLSLVEDGQHRLRILRGEEGGRKVWDWPRNQLSYAGRLALPMMEMDLAQALEVYATAIRVYEQGSTGHGAAIKTAHMAYTALQVLSVGGRDPNTGERILPRLRMGMFACSDAEFIQTPFGGAERPGWFTTGGAELVEKRIPETAWTRITSGLLEESPATFEIGDIVRVAKQPPNHWVHLEGEVGYISEIRLDGLAEIITMKPEGVASGSGPVPFDCLEAQPGEQWRTAKAKIDAYNAKILAEGRLRGVRWTTHIEAVARQHGLTPDLIRLIHQELKAFDD